MLIVLVHLKVLGKLVDASGEKRYLLLGYEYMMRNEYFIKRNKK